MKSRSRKALGIAAIALAVAVSSVARADEAVRTDATCATQATVAAAPGGEPAIEFAGTIVDLSCDSVRLTLSASQCDAGEHIYALKMDGSQGLHPLVITGKPPGSERLRAGHFTGRQVRIGGVRYAKSGGIVVSDICMLG